MFGLYGKPLRASEIDPEDVWADVWQGLHVQGVEFKCTFVGQYSITYLP